MPSCLGIHIENDVIKYAKIRKEKDAVRVEAFNVVFYENLRTAIKKIIAETNSYRIPISVNLSGEMYNYFQVPAMLSKQDMKKAVEIDFELLCEERNYKMNTFETRFLFIPSIENKEKMQGVAISAAEADLAHKKSSFSDVKISTIQPISTAITNLVDPSENSNILIVNIEEQTNVTMMSEGQIVRMDTIPEGMRDIINRINTIENSKQKSYEVCKNTTIYTQDSGEGIEEGNEYIDSILPTLYTIISKVKEIIDDTNINVSKIYITGLATAINNIDLYFQEYFDRTKCEILKPFFANVTSIKTSIKDYIEVNSAIALALSGLGYGYKELNFSDKKAKIRVGNGASVSNVKNVLNNTVISSAKQSFSGGLDATERLITRILVATTIAVLGFSISTATISTKIDDKVEEVKIATASVKKEIDKAETDLKKIEEQTSNYKNQIEQLENLEQNNDKAIVVEQSAIPNLLYRLVDITPKKVKIVSIENNPGTNHIVIQAQSEEYEQLGFLKAAITTANHLENVKSTSGVKNDKIVTTTIEGDLP